jgi:AcrR family transcriptional regulator
LFGQSGYGLVTVADIAAAAGVSPKTVFASVGSKREILDRIIDAGVAAGGCEEAMRQALDLRTPREVLTALAAGIRFGAESQFTVHEAIRLALPVHEDGAALWERATRSSRMAFGPTADHLHTLTPPPRYGAKETADLLWPWFGPTAGVPSSPSPAGPGTAQKPRSARQLSQPSTPSPELRRLPQGSRFPGLPD